MGLDYVERPQGETVKDGNLASIAVRRVRQETPALSISRQGRNTGRIGGRVDGVQQLHAGNVVQVDSVFEDYGQAFAVDVEVEDFGHEIQFANDAFSLSQQ